MTARAVYQKYSPARYRAFRERCNANRRAWIASNPEAHRALCRRQRQKHRAKRKAQQSDWQKRNLPLRRAAEARRRALLKNRLHPLHDRSIELALRKQAHDVSVSTGVRWVIDHIIPLVAGGWHHHLNLQMMPHSLNLSKGTNPRWEMHGYKCWRDVPNFLQPPACSPPL